MTDKRLLTISQRAASSLETLQTSHDLARLAIDNEIPGDFVECGVFAGAQCAAMALAIQSQNRFLELGRTVHLFDSFEGVPEAGPHDKQWTAAGHPKGQSRASLADVVGNMEEWGIDSRLLIYHKGLFANSIPNAIELGMVTRIAILRLDGDLYESTKVSLERFYPLVSPGGWIICDDYGLDGARKATNEYWERKAGHPLIYWQKQ